MALGINECRKNVYSYLESNGFDLDKALSKGFISVTLVLTRSCNLSCPYCYQSKEFKDCPEVMTLETARQAIRFVFSSHPNITDITISLFGGEPFTQFKLVKALVEEYPQVKFSVTTNGLVLVEDPEVLKWVGNQPNLFVSWSANALRFKYGWKFLEKCESLLEYLATGKGEVHYVVDDPEELGIYENVFEMVKAGVQTLRISLPKESDKLVTRREEFTHLFRRIAHRVYKVGDRPKKFGWDAAMQSNAYRVVKGDQPKPQSSSYCGAGWSYVAIDVDGSVYPCDYFIQFKDMRIGHISTGYTARDKVFEGQKDWCHKIYEGCKDCRLGDVRLCTNAMCYAENLKVNKDMFNPTTLTCALRQIEFDIYTYIAHLMKDKELKVDVDKLPC